MVKKISTPPPSVTVNPPPGTARLLPIRPAGTQPAVSGGSVTVRQITASPSVTVHQIGQSLRPSIIRTQQQPVVATTPAARPRLNTPLPTTLSLPQEPVSRMASFVTMANSQQQQLQQQQQQQPIFQKPLPIATSSPGPQQPSVVGMSGSGSVNTKTIIISSSNPPQKNQGGQMNQPTQPGATATANNSQQVRQFDHYVLQYCMHYP